MDASRRELMPQRSQDPFVTAVERLGIGAERCGDGLDAAVMEIPRGDELSIFRGQAPNGCRQRLSDTARLVLSLFRFDRIVEVGPVRVAKDVIRDHSAPVPRWQLLEETSKLTNPGRAGLCANDGDRLLRCVSVTIHETLEADTARPQSHRHGRGAPLPIHRVPPVEQQPVHDDGQVGLERTPSAEPSQDVVVPLEEPDLHVLREVLRVFGRQAPGTGNLTDDTGQSRQMLRRRRGLSADHGRLSLTEWSCTPQNVRREKSEQTRGWAWSG